MFKNLFLAALAVVVLSSDSHAGGGGKSNGTLVIKNVSMDDLAIVIDPPPSLAKLAPPFMPDEEAELKKRATIIAVGGTHSFSVKKGKHKVLAVSVLFQNTKLLDVTIESKKTKKIDVDP